MGRVCPSLSLCFHRACLAHLYLFILFMSKLLEVHLPKAVKMLRVDVYTAGSLSKRSCSFLVISFFSGVQVSLLFLSPGSSLQDGGLS